MSEYNAVGRMVRDPLVALFKVRYPNQLFLTLRNNDELKQEMDKPITMTYWVAPTDASKKVTEYSNDLIQPEFVLSKSGPLETKEEFKNKEEGSNIVSLLLWIGFLIALLFVGSIFLMYYIKQRRQKNLQLQKAIAEGRVSMKNLKDPGTSDEDADENADNPRGHQ